MRQAAARTAQSFASSSLRSPAAVSAPYGKSFAIMAASSPNGLEIVARWDGR